VSEMTAAPWIPALERVTARSPNLSNPPNFRMFAQVTQRVRFRGGGVRNLTPDGED